MAKVSATWRRRWKALSREERKKRTAHLHTDTVNIRRMVARSGKDEVLADLDGYAERAAAYTQLPVASVRPIIREVLGISGRPSQYSHPDICKARGEGCTWSMLGGENPRIAHRQWHRLHHVPSCSPAPP